MTACPHLHDDGAYILGALSPVERVRFERHLATCPACRTAVAELAVLPALLGRVTLSDLRLPEEGSTQPPAESAESAPPPYDVLAGLVDAAQAQRRRDRRVVRWRYAATAVAAAAVAVAIGLSLPSTPSEPVAQPPTPTPTATPAPTTASPVALVAMTPLRSGLSVRAEIGLRSGPWGTEVILHCWYQGQAGNTASYAYQLLAYGPDRKADPIGSWTSGPGDDVRMTGITRYSISDLTRIQLVGSRGTPLLDYEVP